MKEIKYFLISLLSILNYSNIKGQEILNFHAPVFSSKIQKTEILLKLPFFEDFANQSGHANSSLWENSGVYINNTFAINPPSNGVASFDAYNQNGEIYANANYNNHFIADVLSSHSIDLEAPNNENVFLSFYYQAQGIGNQPETNDSLILQFYSPSNENWTTVWFALGEELDDFKYVTLPINQETFLHKGFKFRFLSYCSYNSISTNSTLSNVDFWHIDYIYLNKDRTILDNIFKDVAFLDISNSFTEKYSAIPWKHYLNNQTKAIENFNLKIKNNDNSGRKIKERTIKWQEILTGNSSTEYQLGAINIAANSIEKYEFKTPFEFTDNGLDSSIFMIESKLITDDYDNSVNNTIYHKQVFKDYYAYDDGISEASYGIIGEGSRNAMLAYQFVSSSSGFLNAIDIYFNRPLLEAYSKPFYLTVWNCKNGLPYQILYKKEGTRPEFSSELNKFTRFTIDTTLAIEDSLFIGWIQTSTNSLNIGYDLNRNSAQFTYYNVDGNWNKSSLTGALMLRPVITDKTSQIIRLSDKKSVFAYPNPTNNYININKIQKNAQVQLIDLNGKILWTKQENEFPTTVNRLLQGVYILRIIQNNQIINHQKIIIQH